MIGVPDEEYERIAKQIRSADSPVGIDAEKAHIMILYKLERLEKRLRKLEDERRRSASVQEHHLTVPRTARYATLGDADGSPDEVWFVCHGYRQLADRFLRYFDVLDDGTRLIVAPEALNRFYPGDPSGRHGPDSRVGATWMTRHDRLHEIDDYVGYLDALYDRVFERIERDAVEVHALGFSQGVATVSRWVALGGARVDRLVLWAGFLPPDLDLATTAGRLRRVRLTLVRGEEDGHASPERIRTQAARLDEHGIAHREVTFAGGHRLDAGVLETLAAD